MPNKKMTKYLNLDNSCFSKIMNFLIVNSSSIFFITEISNGAGVLHNKTRLIIHKLCTFNILHKVHNEGGTKYKLNMENEIVKQFSIFHNAVCKQSGKIKNKFF